MRLAGEMLLWHVCVCVCFVDISWRNVAVADDVSFLDFDFEHVAVADLLFVVGCANDIVIWILHTQCCFFGFTQGGIMFYLLCNFGFSIFGHEVF